MGPTRYGTTISSEIVERVAAPKQRASAPHKALAAQGDVRPLVALSSEGTLNIGGRAPRPRAAGTAIRRIFSAVCAAVKPLGGVVVYVRPAPAMTGHLRDFQVEHATDNPISYAAMLAASLAMARSRRACRGQLGVAATPAAIETSMRRWIGTMSAQARDD